MCLNKKIFLFVIILSINLIFTGCIDRWSKKEVEATIIDKTYEKSYKEFTTCKSLNREKYKIIYHPEKYIIIIRYKNITLKKEVKEDIYYKYNKNDTINATLYQGYKDDKLKSEKLNWIP